VRWLAVTFVFACGRTTIPLPSMIPLDDIIVRLDQQVVPSSTRWVEEPLWERIRDYDVYEPATANGSTPIAILIHDG